MVFDFLGAIRLVYIGIDRFLESSGGEIKANAKGLFESVIEPSFVPPQLGSLGRQENRCVRSRRLKQSA